MVTSGSWVQAQATVPGEQRRAVAVKRYLRPVEPATVLAVLVGRPVEHVDASGRLVRTAFRKHVVEGSVLVGTTNLAGDEQADLRVHGGPDKAVLVYSADHADAWRDVDERLVVPGAFGENLHVSGLDESTVCIGDRWSAGSALFEVSQPRQPCWKANDRWGRDDLVDAMERTGRTGWYLRVVETGAICAGDRWTLEERAHANWSVAAASDLMHHRRSDAGGARSLASIPSLSGSWVRTLVARAERLDAGPPTASDDATTPEEAGAPEDTTARRQGPTAG